MTLTSEHAQEGLDGQNRQTIVVIPSPMPCGEGWNTKIKCLIIAVTICMMTQAGSPDPIACIHAYNIIIVFAKCMIYGDFQ